MKTYKEFKLYYSNGTKDEILEEFYEDYKQLFQLQQENDRLNKLLRQLVDEETDWQVNNGQVKLEKLQQEKEELIKWLEEEKEYNLEKYKFWKEKVNYSMMGDYDTKTEILTKILSKIKENEKQ